MGDLRDLDRFVSFARKDAWGQIEDNPARLLYGAVDPASTWAWNKVLGRDDKPLLNQLGSPMGGGDLGLNKSGGVYDRADTAGVDPRMGQNFFGIGDSIAAFYGGSALGGLLGGGGEAAASSQLPTNSVAGEFASPAMSQVPQTSEVAASFGTPSGGLLSSAGSDLQGINKTYGLLNPQQRQQQPIAPQPQPQNTQQQAQARQRLMISNELQSLRMKPGKTASDTARMNQLEGALRGYS